MSNLTTNKILGSVLAVGLGVMGLQTLSHGLFHVEGPEEPAYSVEIAEETGGTEAPVEAGPPDFGLLLASADIAAGERVAKKCVSCHTFDAGMGDMTGPHMWGVMGRTAGTIPGFNYSSAMKDYGKEWQFQNMYDYLENPRAYVPGTAMSFAGLRKQQDRINIIAYLNQQTDSPLPLPEPFPVVETPIGEPGTEGVVEGATAEVVEGLVPAGAETAETAEVEGQAAPQ
jgi:cytochrome c